VSKTPVQRTAAFAADSQLDDHSLALQRALAAASTAADNRGQDICVLDMRGLSDMFDFFVLASGTSRRQLHAMSEEIDRVLTQQWGEQRLGIEGYEESRWILLDYGDVVVHLFDPDTRAYYALEDLWAHAKRVPLPNAAYGCNQVDGRAPSRP